MSRIFADVRSVEKRTRHLTAPPRAAGDKEIPMKNKKDNNFSREHLAYLRKERNKKIIELNKKSLELEKQTFLFNTNIDIQNQQAKIEQIKDTMSYDDEIIKLRTNITTSSEIKMQQGTITVNDYMREVTAENLAKQVKILHEIELLQAVYEMKNIINQ